MGLLSYLRGDDLRTDVHAPAEQRSLPRPDNELPLSGLPAVWSGSTFRTLTPVDALAIADVWAAVRVLADAVSSLPLHVYRKTELGRERVTSGRLVDLLERPSPGVSEADLTSTLMCHLAIWGDGYLAKYRQNGEVTQLALIHPDRIRPELKDGRLRYRYSPGTGPQRLLTEADIVHVKGLSTDSLNGLSAVSQAARVLGLSDELPEPREGEAELRAIAAAFAGARGYVRLERLEDENVENVQLARGLYARLLHPRPKLVGESLLLLRRLPDLAHANVVLWSKADM